MFALIDHDTMAGIPEAIEAIRRFDGKKTLLFNFVFLFHLKHILLVYLGKIKITFGLLGKNTNKCESRCTDYFITNIY